MGVGRVGGDWAGDGRGAGFPDTKSWDFCSYFKKTVPFFSYFYEKIRPLPFRNMTPKTQNFQKNRRLPIWHLIKNLKIEVGIFSDKKSFSQNG